MCPRCAVPQRDQGFVCRCLPVGYQGGSLCRGANARCAVQHSRCPRSTRMPSTEVWSNYPHLPTSLLRRRTACHAWSARARVQRRNPVPRDGSWRHLLDAQQAKRTGVQRGAEARYAHVHGQGLPSRCQSFGFNADLRQATGGQAFPQAVFDHWALMNGAANDKTSKLYDLVKSIRLRKGLKEDVPPVRPNTTTSCKRSVSSFSPYSK
ncbi:hypothetical protein L7F22_024437 [Adiantum nelumboides]|nr:hypothetical protein [Adiantum nelumboides]